MEAYASRQQPPGTTRRQRRSEIKRRLAEHGLSGGRRPYPRAVGQATTAAPAGRLRRGLESLGPVFTAFGRYLGSRVDLLPIEQIRELAALPDRGPATPPERLAEMLDEQLDRTPAEIWEHFEPLPFASGLLAQHHRARLSDGSPVVVTAIHPELVENLPYDLELVAFVVKEIAHGGFPRRGTDQGFPIADPDGVADDFRRTFEQAIDLGRQAEALEQLRRDEKTRDLVVLPRFEPRSTTPWISIREDLGGATLEELFPEPTSAEEPAAEETATRVCRLWLRLAFWGRSFPVDLDARTIEILPDQQLAWTGGVAASLPPAAKDHLRDYLAAVSKQDPDRALDALLEEMAERPADTEALRQCFRQAVPFRDGGRGAIDDLAGNLFLQWRLASEQGCRPRPHLVGFYRGLAGLAEQTRRLAGSGDPLLEGLEKVQFAAGFGELGQMLDPRHLGGQAEESLRLLLDLPRKFDQVLSLAADGQATFKLDMVEPPAERRRKNATSAVVALLLAIVAVGVLARHLASSALGAWIEHLAVVVVLLLGVVLLRVAVGGRR